MITVSIIDKTLEDFFSKSVRGSGEAYHRIGMVGRVDLEGDKVQSTVRGADIEPYKVVLTYNKITMRLDGECNCPEEETCKHQAAVLYAVQKQLQTEVTQSRLRAIVDNSPRVKASQKAKKATAVRNTEIRTNPRPVNKLTLGNENSGTYRKLPLDGKDFYQVLNQFRPRSFQALSWNETFEGVFISESELEIRNVSNQASYRFAVREQKIVLKSDGKDLFVKCLSCDKQMTTLCGHQVALLTKAHPVLQSSGFLAKRVNYETIVNEGVTQTGVDPTAFHDYFNVVLSDTGFSIKAKKQNIVGSDWVRLTKKFIDGDKDVRKKFQEQEVRKLEDGRTKKYAFFWGLERHSYNRKELLLHFVSGNGLKTKEGIQSTNREVETLPKFFAEPYRGLGRQLFFHMKEEDRLIRFTGIQNLIMENLDVMNDIYQYACDGNISEESVRASDMHLINFHPTQLDCHFSVYKKDGLIHFQRQITLEGESFDFSKVVYSNDIFCATSTKAYLYPNYRFNDFMDLFQEQDTLIVPYTNKQEYTALVKGLKQDFDVEIEEDLVMEEEVLLHPEYQILLREVGTFILFEPRLKYGDYSFNAFDADSYHIEEKIFIAEASDREFLINFLKNTHPAFNQPIQVQDYVFLDIKSMINNYWFVHFIEACDAAGIEVLGIKELTKFNYSTHRAVTTSHVKSGIDWFEVDMSVTFGDERIKTSDWIKALRNKETFVKLKDGSLGILPEEWLEQARKVLAVADVEQGDLKISKYRFNVIDDLFETINDKEIIEELRAKKRRLEEIELDKKYPIPTIINAELRDYQKHGFEWLKFLDESGFGGILADDMGLGKTIQVICLLADQIDKGTSMVIVPRSLLFNWAAELDKFCPTLSYVIHHGQGRAKSMEELAAKHIVITTYGTAASDLETFKDFKFNYIILDESQAIKNPDSKRYKAMRILQSNNKLAMTGTPIENNTFDLYAQLSFTSPGLLGSKTSFKNSFAVPIDNNGDTEAANLLRKLVHPFLLRRTKEQVAQDLPAKTESIIYCEMGPTQRKLYNNLKQKIKEDIESEVEEKGVAKSKFKMLDGLLRLRQMCNSPLLLNNSFKGANAESVKINILLQNLTEELDQHNALIFSQFVSLLSIVRKELDDRGIKYCYLDGSTSKRQEEVERFMNDDSIKIFLISLKAGNTGMNLTKADYVYILDPWWNPAVEAQAIDRTHRIGQDKQIFAYKLICKDSIEEKILKLQQKKKSLASDIIRTDENVLKSLQKDELMALFD